MIKAQHLYLAKDFIFRNNSTRKKYFVVFDIDESNCLLFSLTTSQSKLPTNLDTDNSGCVHFDNENGYGHTYILPEGKIIGHEDFAFQKKTYIQFEFRSDLYECDANEIQRKHITKNISECCKIHNDEFCEILKCLIRSKYLKQKQKRSILSLIEKTTSSTV